VARGIALISAFANALLECPPGIEKRTRAAAP
jgi:hypothetical protein